MNELNMENFLSKISKLENEFKTPAYKTHFIENDFRYISRT